MKARGSSVLLFLASSGVSLLLAEAVLRAFGIPPRTLEASHVRDPVLLYRMPAGSPGIDAEGFRNAVPRDRADVVALGDSHTYGFNVEAPDSWPEQLARLTGLTVHNLGMGGYGPLQYLYLTDRALQLQPRALVVGVYPGNDLEDVCIAVRRSPVLEDLAQHEGLDLDHCRRNPGRRRETRAERDGEETAESGVADDWSLLRLARLGVRRWSDRHEPDRGRYFVVRGGAHRTLFSRAGLIRHREALDLDDDEVARNLEATGRSLAGIADRARAAGARSIVLLVPSKQLVFSDVLGRRRVAVPEEFREAVENERRVKAVLWTFLSERGLEAVDSEDFVERALEATGEAYGEDADRHPLAAGYRAYAEAVARALTSPDTRAP